MDITCAMVTKNLSASLSMATLLPGAFGPAAMQLNNPLPLRQGLQRRLHTHLCSMLALPFTVKDFS